MLFFMLLFGVLFTPNPVLCVNDLTDQYINKWAVHVPQGYEAAQDLAHEHGFINHGQVSLAL